MNSSTGDLVVWTDGHSSQSSYKGTVAANSEIITGDYNDDGRSDLLFRDPAGGSMSIWDSANSATAHSAGAVASSWQLFG